ncbi:MAG: excinuclease ABC subunit UvrA [Opitutales bacterium]
MPPSYSKIRLHGVRQNNLKNFDLELPIGRLTVVTGLSGAGKSSLVFETLHAEGQRRYVETFSPYTRQFLELLDRPKVDSVENIRPSIAIQQSNTVRSSRSTVGTITELCDYFKVWFARVATLFDPETGRPVTDDNPQTIWKTLLKEHRDGDRVIAFPIEKPENFSWTSICNTLKSRGFTRVAADGLITRLEQLNPEALNAGSELLAVQDRIKITPGQRARFIEAAEHALGFGKGRISILDPRGQLLRSFNQGLRSPETGRTFRPATPALFSFNSPVGACPQCRGFGRIIEIDDRLVIPDPSLSIEEGAIRPFQGEVYSECLRDLKRAARKHKIRTNIPWDKLTEKEKTFVFEGEPGYVEDGPGWYGIRRFFRYLESKVYKMHVRVFLAKFRSYNICPGCGGARLQPEALNWKWHDFTLPELYAKSVSDLHDLFLELPAPKAAGIKNPTAGTSGEGRQLEAAFESIRSRLGFLREVGLGYLTLDRNSRTLSGGETMRVNLTTCLGSSLTDTLFVLDEPSVGLHARDMDRLVEILRRLTDLGNTVVVVEHDESIMRAADHLIEIGPAPGAAGGELTFSGSYKRILKSRTLTGAFLSGKEQVKAPDERRDCLDAPRMSIYGASRNNLKNIDLHIPQQRLVCLSGVSGSGKSTLLDDVIHRNLLARKGEPVENPAPLQDLVVEVPVLRSVLVDQSPVSKTPRSNPAVFSGAWEAIRKYFAGLDSARSAGLTAGSFSFNSGDGRCEACSGLGYEKIEMQFVSDLYVPCQICEGKRFKPEILEIASHGRSVADLLDEDVEGALNFFRNEPKITRALQPLVDVGLGYLKLGQPLNTLSGGESQRLKLVRYLGGIAEKSAHTCIMVDEPTTGLHRADVRRLIHVLQTLTNAGHSVLVIEHNLDILKVADWLIELGPGAGEDGGKIVAEGPPERIAREKCATASYISDALAPGKSVPAPPAQAAESRGGYTAKKRKDAVIHVEGAREHNLKNITARIPHNAISVVTGVSGSGKSSLAFDIIYAEGQRRFMESMSAYARQFVEQMPRAEVDAIHGIAPTVAIEQRVTKGTRKSTVATITEVAQYLRLLFARIGIQHTPSTDTPVVSQTPDALAKRLESLLKNQPGTPHLYLCAQLVRGRKGHHQPLADWARDHGHALLRVDGKLTPVAEFKKLDRYREHDIELVLGDFGSRACSAEKTRKARRERLDEALRLGKGTAFLLHPRKGILSWLSTRRTDPSTGEAFPELDPKHFSWNSPRGWCPTCRGYGYLSEELHEDDAIEDPAPLTGNEACPDCGGARLNALSRAVKLPLLDGGTLSLPELLTRTPEALLEALQNVATDARTGPVLEELRPEIEERLRFMNRVGLDYINMDRSTVTLSGGEAQRIRLAAQLGSNLSGVLYVLDEPSIGLHARDNAKLIQSLEQLRERGNTLIVVEHDEDTMAHADTILDLGPGAGIHGGEIVACGTLAQLRKHKTSLTGRYLRQAMQHPLRGKYRPIPAAWTPRRKKGGEQWLVLRGANLRNLKGFDLHIPKQRLCVLCGVSGAGKSTLTRDLLTPLVQTAIKTNNPKLTPADLERTGLAEEGVSAHARSSFKNTRHAPFHSLHNAHDIRKAIEVDQSPIGKTPRSTPATYIGAFDIIRELYASLPEARFRGYTAGAFSFNTKGGRCETCKGAGRIKLEMNFMPDTYVTCEDCNGHRYGAELDAIRWNGKNIADVLNLSFEEAAAFFDFHTPLKTLLELMVETGLGYLTLGQNSPSLSGGEAQRLKLVSELAKGLPSMKERNYGKGQGNLYLLEEPTIGLHARDCERLLELLHRLVDNGHTVLVIEHHLDIIKDADHVIEIGPDGGEAGGQMLYQGDLSGLRESSLSVTAPFL